MENGNGPLTKRDLKQLKKLEKLDYAKAAQRQNMVKWIVIGVSSILFLTFFTILVIVSKQNSQKAVTVALSSSGWVRGDEKAPVTIAEFSDLQCPACKAYKPMIDQALSEFSGKVKLLYKHFPLPSHKNGIPAAKAAEAAGSQGKFWEMHDLLFEKQDEWAILNAADINEKLVSYAKELKLDEEKFKKDLEDKKLEEKITSQKDEGAGLGVNATPTFYINSQKVENLPPSYPELKKLIEKYVK